MLVCYAVITDPQWVYNETTRVTASATATIVAVEMVTKAYNMRFILCSVLCFFRCAPMHSTHFLLCCRVHYVLCTPSWHFNTREKLQFYCYNLHLFTFIYFFFCYARIYNKCTKLLALFADASFVQSNIH